MGPPASDISFHRTIRPSAPIITGYVALQGENGQFTRLPGAIVLIDNAHTLADKDGRYTQVVSPGRHKVLTGGIGLIWSEAPSLQVEPGDSIQVNFHLLPDFRPIID